MTGIIQNKHQIAITTVPYFANQGVSGYSGSEAVPAASDIRFKVTVDGKDRMLIDAEDYSATGGSPHGRVVIMGDVHIEGKRTFIDALDLRVQDNVILLNKTESTGDSVAVLNFSGVEVSRAPGTNTAWLFDEANDWWGPYGPAGANSTIPTRTLGNIAEIDSRTTPLVAGLTTLYLDTDRVILRDQSGGNGHYGSAANPTITWEADENTGLYHDAADQIGFATGGSRRLYLNNNHLVCDAMTGSLVVPRGTTAQRLDSFNGGELRYNTERKILETRQDGGGWAALGYYSIPAGTATPPNYYHNGLTGLDAYNVPDQPTMHRSGWTMMHAGGLQGVQFSVSWNNNGGVVPDRPTIRVKDDTGTDWSAWRELPWRDEVLLLNGTQAMTGNLNMGGNRIQNMADPDSDDDAINRGYADGRYVNVTGDAMTGNLAMGGNRITGLGDATADGDAVSRKFADDRFVNVSGDTMTGTLNTRDLLPAGGAGTSSVGTASTYYSVGSFTTVNTNRLNPISGTAEITVSGGFISTATNTGTLGTVATVWGETHVNHGNYNLISVTDITPVNTGSITLSGGTGGGFFSGSWTLNSGATLNSTYADVAERYAADRPYEPGTVVVFGGVAEITAATLPHDPRVAGIISTAPAFKLNATAGCDDTHPYVALKGRVPCRAVGPIRKGDLLTTGDLPGHAVRATEARTGTVLGKAIGSLGSGEVGVIEVMAALM